MNEKRRHLLLVVALQQALQEDGHTDPREAFHWAVRQGLIYLQIDLSVERRSLPDSLHDIVITPRGREYLAAWSERQMDQLLEEILRNA